MRKNACIYIVAARSKSRRGSETQELLCLQDIVLNDQWNGD